MKTQKRDITWKGFVGLLLLIILGILAVVLFMHAISPGPTQGQNGNCESRGLVYDGSSEKHQPQCIKIGHNLEGEDIVLAKYDLNWNGTGYEIRQNWDAYAGERD